MKYTDPENSFSIGITEFHGVNRLKGAGLETANAPGIMSAGGMWPGRYVLTLYRLFTFLRPHFFSIGFIELDGVHRLKGPGLETEDTPGVMQGGGKWPNRYAHASLPFQHPQRHP